MVSCLNPCYNGMTMESNLRFRIEKNYASLNPCYNGMTMEWVQHQLDMADDCLNPCYNGMTMESVQFRYLFYGNGVLILVIME